MGHLYPGAQWRGSWIPLSVSKLYIRSRERTKLSRGQDRHAVRSRFGTLWNLLCLLHCRSLRIRYQWKRLFCCRWFLVILRLALLLVASADVLIGICYLSTCTAFVSHTHWLIWQPNSTSSSCQPCHSQGSPIWRLQKL